MKSQEICKLYSLNHIIINVCYTELKLALCNVTTAKTLAMSGPTASKPLDVFCLMVAICRGNALWLHNLRRAAAIAL
jgi:hypothetical protein